jgi:hypothetical protein
MLHLRRVMIICLFQVTLNYELIFFQFGFAVDKDSITDHKRWAVMMIGGARTYAYTQDSFTQNVVNQAYPPMDVFVSSHFNNLSRAEILSFNLLVDDSTEYQEYTPTITSDGLNTSFKRLSWDITQTQDRFLSEQMALLQIIDDYSKYRNITYDFIFYTRPDLLFTYPVNIKKLEEILGKNSAAGKSTIFSPDCCAWSGWCDRVGAASYQDFSRMIRVSDQWVANVSRLTHERAFRDRGLLSNLSSFDMHLMEDYGFLTLRIEQAVEACQGRHELHGSKHSDTTCSNFLPFNLNVTLATCDVFDRNEPTASVAEPDVLTQQT